MYRFRAFSYFYIVNNCLQAMLRSIHKKIIPTDKAVFPKRDMLPTYDIQAFCCREVRTENQIPANSKSRLAANDTFVSELNNSIVTYVYAYGVTLME